MDAAAATLKRAVEYDGRARWTEAQVCYQEGAQMLLDAVKGTELLFVYLVWSRVLNQISGVDERDETKRLRLRQKAEQYVTRAEQLREQVERAKRRGEYQEQRRIEDGSVGHSYESVFGRFLDSATTTIRVLDPYIRALHQVQNLVRLCELAVRRCGRSLQTVCLLTTRCPKSPRMPDDETGKTQQDVWLATLQADLRERHGVTFDYVFSDTLHDREIQLNSGWLIKIGRGLDYFKPPSSKLSLGAFDLDLRPCRETLVDIVHVSKVRSTT
ncbi:unnamed protein product [Notodromas monacha]|uniref:MITD1 C-terminal phospholipase D-like domain-containing protein n=1 Tax=Notodromas monacha TaxID=399045 RepID=A0A7R9BGE5_9CRUS|nr:unnamed protein product [Notodromas monacha]CAG0913682.1 unnamed protein product [Notodromas monacha]